MEQGPPAALLVYGCAGEPQEDNGQLRALVFTGFPRGE
jgi:hypothetical protein